ncbi:MAG: RnfABCDGE type electron transport complex subunit D [Clostridia bacterium]|nr:RnfABCDGE type electron transport complex subunit D [Clostridia bacterium]MBQ6883075.1 RnfABCDGE type electron transport complex subunit D [Clostridia bacterium]
MKKLIVSTSPHIKSPVTTQNIMLDVLIALAPATVMAVVLFGLRALLIIGVCVVTAVVSEFIFNLINKRKQTVLDLSATVTGLLLALNLPLTATVWQCIVGSIFAIIVVKCLFGGLGHNFANPAITARIFLLLSFSTTIAGGTSPQLVDVVASATPLAAIKDGATHQLPSLLHMLIGLRGGAIGEVCSIALIIGYIYLVVKKVIHFETPLIFVATVFLLSWLIKGDITIALYQVLGGGLLLGAIFMATDYVTTPINRVGKMVFALGCGLITVLIRFYGNYPEGVSFSILLMNILSPYIEKLCKKKAFGGAKNV